MKFFKLEIKGLVQGIGFRPFVAEQAENLGLLGQVYNAGGVVFITVIGEGQALEEFIQRLTLLCPKPGYVDEVKVTDEGEADEKLLPEFGERFLIVTSVGNEDEIRFVPADLCTCKECEAELMDSNNRRFRHPFISCVTCGPRYSIMKTLPYDRDTITMDEFELCEDCASEYREKGNRRRHAQTIACKECGPRLWLKERISGKSNSWDNADSVGDETCLKKAVELLKKGRIGAVKDIGGYHICFDPFDEKAARRLREWKNREKKPFAVMFANVDEVRQFAGVSAKEEELLESCARPIVLLNKFRDFAWEICCESDRIGAMLPCNPLQILLIKECGPLVMTSANRGGEPIIVSDEEALSLLEEGAVDFVLGHDRKILTPLEDSVTQVHAVDGQEKVQFIRRGRGYVPNPVDMGRGLKEDALACGGDLKSVFALGKKNFAYLSGPYGDLEEFRCTLARDKEVKRMEDILFVEPKDFAMDAHPLYQSRLTASGQSQVKEIYHHHAHLLSVMAEHNLTKALGIAWDGTGYGSDGGIWGGEWLLCENNDFKRLGSIRPVKLQGNDEASKDCGLAALGYLMEAGIVNRDNLLCFEESKVKIMSLDFGKVKSTSVGRLFDAVAFVLGVCDYNSFEGEAANCLESLALKAVDEASLESVVRVLRASCKVTEYEGRAVLDTVSLVAKLYELKEQGEDFAVLSRAFHEMLAAGCCELVEDVLPKKDLPVVFSGGCFANRLLYRGIFEGLTKRGYEVFVNETVPCTDGGVALGQLYSLTF